MFRDVLFDKTKEGDANFCFDGLIKRGVEPDYIPLSSFALLFWMLIYIYKPKGRYSTTIIQHT